MLCLRIQTSATAHNVCPFYFMALRLINFMHLHYSRSNCVRTIKAARRSIEDTQQLRIMLAQYNSLPAHMACTIGKYGTYPTGERLAMPTTSTNFDQFYSISGCRTVLPPTSHLPISRLAYSGTVPRVVKLVYVPSLVQFRRCIGRWNADVKNGALQSKSSGSILATKF